MIISYTEIKDSCFKAIEEATRRGDYEAAVFFKLLYKTGFRASEILDFTGWQKMQDGNLLVPAHKKGNPKIVNRNVLEQEIYNSIGTNNVFQFSYSKSALQRLFVQYSGLHSCYVGKKRITLHAFRHVFIKTKVSEGFAYNEINSLLGIRQVLTTVHYVFKQYQTEPFDVDQ